MHVYVCRCLDVVVQFLSFCSNFIFLCFKLIIFHYDIQPQKKRKLEPRIALKYNMESYIVN